MAASSSFAKLPPSLHAERKGDIAILRLARPEKRNALDDATVLGIEAFFSSAAGRHQGRRHSRRG